MRLLRSLGVALFLLCSIPAAFASAYNARPKLIVVIVIDQFRGDYLERYRDQFGDGGFRVFIDRGAYFTDCNYDYANTRTAPGHATLFTGSYTSGHGIIANEWWDPQKKKRVTSVEDDTTKLVGVAKTGVGASPHNLLSDTLGDELKLATGGKARVFAISLKDGAAVLPAGFSGDAAYWIDPKSGDWITSTYYRPDLPEWVRNFNGSHRAEKFWNREWRDKDGDGNTLGSTAPRNGKDGTPAGFYEVVGSTPFANDYQLEFAKELVLYEKLGAGPATDLLVVSLSANDILGHQVGPDSRQMRSMALELDRSLAEFFSFLGHQIGMANVWMALSADHGVAPLPDFAKTLRLPTANLDAKALREQIQAHDRNQYLRRARPQGRNRQHFTRHSFRRRLREQRRNCGRPRLQSHAFPARDASEGGRGSASADLFEDARSQIVHRDRSAGFVAAFLLGRVEFLDHGRGRIESEIEGCLRSREFLRRETEDFQWHDRRGHGQRARENANLHGGEPRSFRPFLHLAISFQILGEDPRRRQREAGGQSRPG